MIGKGGPSGEREEICTKPVTDLKAFDRAEVITTSIKQNESKTD